MNGMNVAIQTHEIIIRRKWNSNNNHNDDAQTTWSGEEWKRKTKRHSNSCEDTNMIFEISDKAIILSVQRLNFIIYFRVFWCRSGTKCGSYEQEQKQCTYIAYTHALHANSTNCIVHIRGDYCFNLMSSAFYILFFPFMTFSVENANKQFSRRFLPRNTYWAKSAKLWILFDWTIGVGNERMKRSSILSWYEVNRLASNQDRLDSRKYCTWKNGQEGGGS